MPQFTADIAGMLEIFAIATGLVLLHIAATRPRPRLLKLAGWILIAGGIFVGICTIWYWLDYGATGAFDHAPTTHLASDRPNLSPVPTATFEVDR